MKINSLHISVPCTIRVTSFLLFFIKNFQSAPNYLAIIPANPVHCQTWFNFFSDFVRVLSGILLEFFCYVFVLMLSNILSEIKKGPMALLSRVYMLV